MSGGGSITRSANNMLAWCSRCVETKDSIARDDSRAVRSVSLPAGHSGAALYFYFIFIPTLCVLFVTWARDVVTSRTEMPCLGDASAFLALSNQLSSSLFSLPQRGPRNIHYLNVIKAPLPLPPSQNTGKQTNRGDKEGGRVKSISQA